MSAPKLPADAFHAQFPHHERHLTEEEHDYVPSDLIYPEKTAAKHPHPDYSRKKKAHHPKKTVSKALKLVIGH